MAGRVIAGIAGIDFVFWAAEGHLAGDGAGDDDVVRRVDCHGVSHGIPVLVAAERLAPLVGAG